MSHDQCQSLQWKSDMCKSLQWCTNTLIDLWKWKCVSTALNYTQFYFKTNYFWIWFVFHLHNRKSQYSSYISNYSDAESIEKLRIIIFKIHQTVIQNKKYYIFKIIDFDDKNFENNTKKFENNLNHVNMLIHNLIQNVKYFNFNVDNLVLFFYIHDSLKLFYHQITDVFIMLK